MYPHIAIPTKKIGEGSNKVLFKFNRRLPESRSCDIAIDMTKCQTFSSKKY